MMIRHGRYDSQNEAMVSSNPSFTATVCCIRHGGLFMEGDRTKSTLQHFVLINSLSALLFFFHYSPRCDDEMPSIFCCLGSRAGLQIDSFVFASLKELDCSLTSICNRCHPTNPLPIGNRSKGKSMSDKECMRLSIIGLAVKETLTFGTPTLAI